MWAWLLTPAAARVIGGVGALLALGLLYACGVQEGRQSARVKSMERVIEAVETRRDVEDTVAREPDPAERLLTDGWVRD